MDNSRETIEADLQLLCDRIASLPGSPALQMVTAKLDEAKGWHALARQEMAATDQDLASIGIEPVVDMPHPDIPAHVTRMQTELTELTDRLAKLDAFLGTGPYTTLPAIERQGMLRQRRAMSDYREALAERVERATA